MDINSVIVGIQYHEGVEALNKGDKVELVFNDENNEYPTGIRVFNNDGVLVGNIIANMNHPSISIEDIALNNLKNNAEIRKITTNSCKATVVAIKRYVVFITIHTTILVDNEDNGDDNMDLKAKIESIETKIEENKLQRRQLRRERVALRKELKALKKQLEEVENNTDEVVEETTDVKEEKGETMIEKKYTKEVKDEEIDELDEATWSIFTKCDEIGAKSYVIDSKYIIEAYYENTHLCEVCEEKLRKLGFEEVTSSKSSNNDEDGNGNMSIEEKITKINKETITQSVMERNVKPMGIELMQSQLTEALDKAKEEYPIESMAFMMKYIDLHPIATVIMTLRSIDDLVSKRYLEDKTHSGEFDHMRAYIGVHSYFYYEHIIEKVSMEDFFTEASLKASEKFSKEQEEREREYKNDDEDGGDDTTSSSSINIEFVEYDGSYPNLCSGDLTINVNGTEHTIKKYSLISGGSVWFEDGDEHVEHGSWTIREDALPDELKPYKEEIEKVINKNIPKGCCGGCI